MLLSRGRRLAFSGEPAANECQNATNAQIAKDFRFKLSWRNENEN